MYLKDFSVPSFTPCFSASLQVRVCSDHAGASISGGLSLLTAPAGALPFRSPRPTPAMPSPCRPPPRPSPWQPTHPTTTSPSCTATGDPDARITRRRAQAPFRPALTASWTMRITRPHRSTCPPESSRRRAAAATIGTGGRGSTATCRSARRTPGTTALKAACQTASGRTMRSATSAMARARRFSVCRT